MVRKPKKKVSKQSQLVKCKGCSVLFFPDDRRQKFHNPECRTRYYMEHYGSPPVNKTCLNCGSSFQTAMPEKQSYCRPECREEHRLKVQDELKARVVAEKQTFLGERFAAMQKDNFKCVYCGRGKEQGVILDVVDVGHELKTVCLECKAGKESLGK